MSNQAMSEQITISSLRAYGFVRSGSSYVYPLLEGYTRIIAWFDGNNPVFNFEGVRNDCTFSGIETMEELHKLISWLPES